MLWLLRDDIFKIKLPLQSQRASALKSAEPQPPESEEGHWKVQVRTCGGEVPRRISASMLAGE